MRTLVAGFLALLSAVPAQAKRIERSPCPSISFVGADSFKLSAAQKRLVCGDPETEGWNSIPLNQARYFLTSFLQEKAYLNPRFDAVGPVLRVDIGAQARITKVTVAGLPPGIDPSKRRGLKGLLLTPKALDKVKATFTDALQNEGYACPALRISADATTGEVSVDVAAGSVYRMKDIRQIPLPGVDLSVFNRYEAYRYGQRLDMRLLTLTAQRTVAEALFLSAYFDVSCASAAMTITQRVVEAKPRLVKVGVGVDTEGYVIGRARWKHSRVGWRASTVEADLYGSVRRQAASAVMHYYLEPASRLHLIPHVLFQRQNEARFETVNAEVSINPATSWDDSNIRVEVNAGPALEYVDTIRGQGPGSDTYLGINTRTDVISHFFEFYARDPRTGWRASFHSASRLAGVYSQLTAHRLRVSGESLWNVGAFDPPLFVVGTRSWAGTIVVNDQTLASRELPAEQRFFLGGDQDLRGAARQELPADAQGFFTAVYEGVELRLAHVLPFGVQPLVFTDAAMAGRRQFQLDRDVYWSPGFGLRWGAPFGTIRTTLARGFVWRRAQPPPLHKPHWQFFFSFGREF